MIDVVKMTRPIPLEESCLGFASMFRANAYDPADATMVAEKFGQAAAEIKTLRAEIAKLRAERDKAHAAGLREGAEALTRWSSDTQIMKLAMGEMTAQEVRSVVAALKQRSAAIRARAEAVSPDLHKTSKQGETGNDA